MFGGDTDLLITPSLASMELPPIPAAQVAFNINKYIKSFERSVSNLSVFGRYKVFSSVWNVDHANSNKTPMTFFVSNENWEREGERFISMLTMQLQHVSKRLADQRRATIMTVNIPAQERENQLSSMGQLRLTSLVSCL